MFNRYEGLFARSLLAAIDHNHHLHRKQARNAKGELVFFRRWSKRAKRWKVVIVKEKKTYSYIASCYVCQFIKRSQQGVHEEHKTCQFKAESEESCSNNCKSPCSINIRACKRTRVKILTMIHITKQPFHLFH